MFNLIVVIAIAVLEAFNAINNMRLRFTMKYFIYITGKQIRD